MDKSTEQTVSDHWSRTEAINWLIRALHNEAVTAYMSELTPDRFDRIVKILSHARDDLQVLRIGVAKDDLDFGCPAGWCPDVRDRCQPCEE